MRNARTRFAADSNQFRSYIHVQIALLKRSQFIDVVNTKRVQVISDEEVSLGSIAKRLMGPAVVEAASEGVDVALQLVEAAWLAEQGWCYNLINLTHPKEVMGGDGARGRSKRQCKSV